MYHRVVPVYTVRHPEKTMQHRVAPPGGTPIHYLYGYVPPKGVVILKLLV